MSTLGDSVLSWAAKTIQIDSLRFTDKDLDLVGTLEYGQFGVVSNISLGYSIVWPPLHIPTHQWRCEETPLLRGGKRCVNVGDAKKTSDFAACRLMSSLVNMMGDYMYANLQRKGLL